MNTMRCEQCGRFVDGKPCPFCQSTRVRPLRPGETPTSPLETKSGEVPPPASPPASPVAPPTPRPRAFPALPPAKSEEKKAEPVRPARAAEENRPEPSRPVRSAEERVEPLPGMAPPPSPRADAIDDQRPSVRARVRPSARPDVPAPPQPVSPEVQDLEKFEAQLKEGFKAIVICGRGHSGKSEITSGFTRANTVFRGRAIVSTTRARSGNLYTVAGTGHNTVWFEVMNTRRKLVFLDPSGELYLALSPSERQRLRLPDVTAERLSFVRAASKRLAGIVLVVDLTRTLDDMSEAPWLDQELDLSYELSILRWLRRGKGAGVEQGEITARMASDLQGRPRLDVPVLTLFSKADLLGETTNELPLSFAQRKLQTLYGSILTHARHFRFDFVSTMQYDEKNDVNRQSPRPCGVLLPMEWLVGGPFRWLPSLPTQWLGGGS